MSNEPTELDLLRRVASAAQWALASNGDDPVGRDGRKRIGINYVSAYGALNRALRELSEMHPVDDLHDAERKSAADHEAALKAMSKTAR